MSVAGKAPGLPWRVATQTKPPKQRRGGSSRLLFLDPAVPSLLLSLHHSTALPSPKRYDDRYEKRFSETEVLCLHQLPAWMWRCGAADRILTNKPGDVSVGRHPFSNIITIPPSLCRSGDGDDRS